MLAGSDVLIRMQMSSAEIIQAFWPATGSLFTVWVQYSMGLPRSQHTNGVPDMLRRYLLLGWVFSAFNMFLCTGAMLDPSVLPQ